MFASVTGCAETVRVRSFESTLLAGGAGEVGVPGAVGGAGGAAVVGAPPTGGPAADAPCAVAPNAEACIAIASTPAAAARARLPLIIAMQTPELLSN